MVSGDGAPADALVLPCGPGHRTVGRGLGADGWCWLGLQTSWQGWGEKGPHPHGAPCLASQCGEVPVLLHWSLLIAGDHLQGAVRPQQHLRRENPLQRVPILLVRSSSLRVQKMVSSTSPCKFGFRCSNTEHRRPRKGSGGCTAPSPPPFCATIPC